jgi:hypothetical protein
MGITSDPAKKKRIQSKFVSDGKVKEVLQRRKSKETLKALKLQSPVPKKKSSKK